VGLALVYCGARVLLGAHQSFRVGGLLAVLAGAPLVTLVVLFLLRPVTDGSEPFRLRARGYDPADVDAFLPTITGVTPEQIRATVFGLASPGYDQREVDAVLDRAEAGVFPAAPAHRRQD
jgi:DivIVA domain-containing protein